MTQQLAGKKIAILVADGFDQSELVSPRQALDEAGAHTEIVSPVQSTVRGWLKGNWADEFAVDVQLGAANPDEYDALLLPGGTINPDRLRREPQAVQFVRAFFEAGKPIASICHGPWMLVEADILRGRTATSFYSIKTDLKNAGANWVDQEVVVDQGIITSRNPGDLPAFNAKMIEEFAEGRHER
jgi:protease I